MKLTKVLWILTSLGLWLTVGIFSTSFLIEQRALSSLDELKGTETPFSALQTSAALANIRTSLHISDILHGKGLSYSPEWLATLLLTIEKITDSDTLPIETIEKLPSTCTECNTVLQSNLKTAVMLARQGKIKEQAYERILELQEKLKDEKKLQIKLHILLAKDFAELLGSVPLYQSKGESGLIYYDNGPFKGLPRLDESARADSIESSQAVENLSQKIESLKSQSLLIIQNYQNAANKLEKSVQAIATLEGERAEIRTKIKILLLDGLKYEIRVA